MDFTNMIRVLAICLLAKLSNKKTNKNCWALLLALRLASVKMAANLVGGFGGLVGWWNYVWLVGWCEAFVLGGAVTQTFEQKMIRCRLPFPLNMALPPSPSPFFYLSLSLSLRLAGCVFINEFCIKFYNRSNNGIARTQNGDINVAISRCVFETGERTYPLPSWPRQLQLPSLRFNFSFHLVALICQGIKRGYINVMT